ncbi:MAG: ASPIC/UnbV domain-containing protein, partial [bacterium]|nr:ASPIC/UnbV domain-containing protein [bacterium]
GDLDIVVVNSNQPSEVYENRTSGNWSALEPSTRGAAGTASIGARIVLVTGERRQFRETRAGSSYLSQSTLAAFFGLADEERVDRMTVRQPAFGRMLVLRDLPANRRLLLRR